MQCPCHAVLHSQARRLLRPGLVAKRRRAERLLEQLNGAAAAPEVDYASPFLK
jgi:hypothetical protein